MMKVLVSVYIFSIVVILLLLNPQIFGTLIQTPSSACNGEDVTVKCILDVPNTNDMFTSVFIRFIIANPAASLSENEVNIGTGDYFGVKLTRLTAMDDPSSSNSVQLVGSITLSSFNSTDEGLLLGCSGAYIVDGNVSDTADVSETIPLNQAAIPSPPVNLSADFNSTTCSGTVELSWIPGVSNRSIQMYYLFQNGDYFYTTSNTSYSNDTTLEINRDYNYSVVAMSCAGNSTEATADPFSYGVPSSPPVTLSEPNNNCTNILISWTTPDSDLDIIGYSVYRNNTFLLNTTATEYTDTIVLNANTVYEYSVRAGNCLGSSIPGVSTVSINGYLLSVNSQTLSYNETASEIYFNWTLSSNNENITIYLDYSLDLTYNHSNSSVMNKYSHTYSFSQLSSDTNYTQAITPPEFDKGNVDTNITACLQITKQCRQPVSGIRMCDYYESELHTTPTNSPVSLLPAVVILIVIIIIILIISISVISAMSIVIVIMYRKIQSIKSTDKPTEPAHLYQYIDMDKLTPGSTPRQEDPYYTPMSPTGTQSRPEYGNLK